MPILEITNTHITQRCASCGGTFEVAIEKVKPSDADPKQAPGILALPQCSCGACEFLIRSTDKEATQRNPGSPTHLHRLLVDALVDTVNGRAKADDSKGQLVDEVSSAIGADIVAKWFPEGLKVALSIPNDSPSNKEGKPWTTLPALHPG